LLLYGEDFGTVVQGAEAVAAELGTQVQRFRLADLAYTEEPKERQACTARQALVAATQVRQVVLITDERGWLGDPKDTGLDKTREAMEDLSGLPGCVIVATRSRAPRLARALRLFHREVGFGRPDLDCRRRAWARVLGSAEAVDSAQLETLAREHELSMGELMLAVERAAFHRAASGDTQEESLAAALASLRGTDGPLFGAGRVGETHGEEK
jgi:hypothetical protein